MRLYSELGRLWKWWCRASVPQLLGQQLWIWTCRLLRRASSRDVAMIEISEIIQQWPLLNLFIEFIKMYMLGAEITVIIVTIRFVYYVERKTASI